jgi:aspartyl-tRNA(Asn)/glutamyl-tRNA(Gln) amidotransferase subunit C
MSTHPQPHPISAEHVRHIAMLARLDIPEADIPDYQQRLGAILHYVNRLSAAPIDGVEPLTQPGNPTDRMGEDEPGPTLSTATLMAMAPETLPPFVKIPKVIGDGGGA